MTVSYPSLMPVAIVLEDVALVACGEQRIIVAAEQLARRHLEHGGDAAHPFEIETALAALEV